MNNLNLIACISKDYGLGKNGKLLWNIPEDMQFFRQTTSGGIVVMGRKTYESIGRPLPHRENIILSRQDLQIDGVTCFNDFDRLCQFLERQTKAIYVIGGASLYQMFLNSAEKLYLTEVNASKSADTFFPTFDRSQYSRKILQSGQQDDILYNIVEYTRKHDLSR